MAGTGSHRGSRRWSDRRALAGRRAPSARSAGPGGRGCCLLCAAEAAAAGGFHWRFTSPCRTGSRPFSAALRLGRCSARAVIARAPAAPGACGASDICTPGPPERRCLAILHMLTSQQEPQLQFVCKYMHRTCTMCKRHLQGAIHALYMHLCTTHFLCREECRLLLLPLRNRAAHGAFCGESAAAGPQYWDLVKKCEPEWPGPAQPGPARPARPGRRRARVGEGQGSS